MPRGHVGDCVGQRRFGGRGWRGGLAKRSAFHFDRIARGALELHAAKCAFRRVHLTAQPQHFARCHFTAAQFHTFTAAHLLHDERGVGVGVGREHAQGDGERGGHRGVRHGEKDALVREIE